MPRDRRGNESRWEWVAAAVSAALVLSVLALLAYDAVVRPQTPPAVEVRADTVLQAGGLWLVEFEAFNRGHNTAAAVKVEGRISGAAGEVETSEAVVDYVPGRSRRRGGLFFRHDPRVHRLELRALGYQEP
ncbi:MAG TPA: TIGR02588 family protein [Longimicrobium sp.]|nr:TIGR02588 family protein [Longimicrobium sp.]